MSKVRTMDLRIIKMTDRKEFASAKADVKSTGVQEKVDIAFGKSMMNSIDRGFSPIQQLHEVVAERVKEQEKFMQIARDNFLRNER